MLLNKIECLEWCFGDLLNNAVRGTVAEYLVAVALGNKTEKRGDWDSYDLLFKGLKIEVKSSAYLQSWQQSKPSILRFNITPSIQEWSYEIGDWEVLKSPRRVADIYIFCLFKETDKAIADPLNTEQWDFYAVKTEEINDLFGNQKTVAGSRLLKGREPVSFGKLKDEILSVKML